MLLREFTQQEGIVDAAVQFHKELNPKLWHGNVLKPKVRYKLLQIAKHFVDFINIPEIGLKDITISGSNAAYSYTPLSDIDLHLVVSIPPDDAMLLKPLYDAKKNQYNYVHDIKIRGIDVELYVQDEEQKHHSLGIYSVLNNKWVEEPTMGTIKVHDGDVKAKVANYLNKIMQALTDDDINNVLEVQEEISRLRKAGLEQGGEFSVENIAFKVLRAKGFIGKLKQHLLDLQDRLLSLETLNMKRDEIIGEHKKGRRAVIYNKKPKTVVEPPKPRNFVAKNATTSGAGAHTDKKKAAKQGQTKHKGQMDMAEAYGRYGRRDAYQRDYDSSVSGMGRPHRDMSDEANLLYIYRDGRVKQRMVNNPDERQARAEGFRDTVEQALKLHGIIRSKFDPKKWVQKSGDKWVQVHPFGKPEDTTEDVQQDLTVAKDDDKSTQLIDKNTGVTQTIDKTNPKAPRLTQDPQGKLILTAPGGQATGTAEKPNFVGKTVSVMPTEATHNTSASPSQPGDEEDSINTKSVHEDNAVLALIRGVK